MSDYKYTSDFYEYIAEGSTTSAQQIIPILLDMFNIKSVLDVGCGRGAWLKIWGEYNVKIIGIDTKTDSSSLLVSSESFVSHDLSTAFDLGQQFSLVQCLEVAEHLPKNSSDGLIKSLIKHGDIILFSAAPPGQGGENHINEKSYDYWKEAFTKHGYEMHDIVRPLIKNNKRIKNYYRYNTFIFTSKHIKQKYNILKKKKYLVLTKPLDVSPLSYKLRKLLLRFLPVFFITKLAVLNRFLQKIR